MRALLLVTVTLALAAACSRPGPEEIIPASSQFESELELAILSGRPDTPPELAPDELHQPEIHEPATRSAPRPDGDTRAPVAAEPSLLGDPIVAHLASAEPETLAPAPGAGAIDVTPVTVDGEAAAAEEGEDGPRLATPRGGIIIRGGVSGRDPCKLHLPGMGDIAGALTPDGHGGVLGGMGAMIHDRAPRIDRGRGMRSPDRRPAIRMGGSVFRGTLR